MKTKAVFVADTRSLYYGIRNKFVNRGLKYLDLVKKMEVERDLNFAFKFAFGKYDENKYPNFNTLLIETGFKVFFDRKYYDAQLALQVAKVLPHVDAVVLASCWYGHFPVLEYAKDFGKATYAIGVNLPQFLRYYSVPIEIDQGLTSERRPREDNEQPIEADDPAE